MKNYVRVHKEQTVLKVRKNGVEDDAQSEKNYGHWA